MHAPAADESLIGTVLADKYRIVRPIGRGGMGVVYEAEHVQLGKRLAIKLMLDKYAHDSEAIARFQREAYAASRIGNEHIIDVSDIGVAFDGRPFVAMELLQGSSLAQVIETTGPMPPWRAIHIMRQVLRAVGAAHAKGIVHRDLKPDNIFLIERSGYAATRSTPRGSAESIERSGSAATRSTPGGSAESIARSGSAATRSTSGGSAESIARSGSAATRSTPGGSAESIEAGQHDFVKLLDFGISKITDVDEQVAFTKLTSTGVVMGTPLYMPPEQAMGNPVEAAADIYACGVILYEMLAGKPPFEGATYAVLVAKVLTTPPPYLGQVRPGLPLSLVTAVHRALEKEPRDRFASAEQFAASLPGDRTPSQIELAGTLDSGIAVVPPVGYGHVRPSLSQPAQRRRWPFVVFGAAIVAAAAVIAIVLVSRADRSAKPATSAQSSEPTTPAKPPAPIDPTPARPIVEPLATTGTLDIQTTPRGATITVDGTPRGTTPASIRIEEGDHRIVVELAGYVGVEYDAQVRTSERTSVVIPLVKGSSKGPRNRGGRRDSGARPAITTTITTTNPPATAPRVTTTPEPPTGVPAPNPLPHDRNPYDDPPPRTVPKASGSGKPNPY